MRITTSYTKYEILDYLVQVDSLFNPPLSERVDLDDYVDKLSNHAHILCYKAENKIVAAIFYYINDDNEAYIPVLGCVEGYEGRGLMLSLVKNMERQMVHKNVVNVSLTTWNKSRALNFYVKNGFVVTKVIADRPNEGKTIHLRKNLKAEFGAFDFIEPPIEINPRLNEYLGINLMIKRDDLFPVTGGGSKARKLKFILKRALENGCTSVVTAGSNYSNHLRATAVMCSELGLKFTACIHDEEPAPAEIKGNLKLTLDMAYRTRFVKMIDIKTCMDNAILSYIDEGEKPLYLWGGGHCVEATFSYINAIEHLPQDVQSSAQYIFIASGTGTTQAGITLGAQTYMPECKVVGVSIARDQIRGSRAIADAIEEAKPYCAGLELNHSDHNVIFDDRYLCGGYGKADEILLEELAYVKKNFGLILDPIYSGKAYFALKNYISSGEIAQGSNVVFWNTGGLLNVLS